MKKEIKPGDIVRLKSGGPNMTVTESESVYAKCIFYNESKAEYQSLSFEVVVLTPVD